MLPPIMVPAIAVLPKKRLRQMVHASVCRPACAKRVCLRQRQNQYWLLLLLLHLAGLLLKGSLGSKDRSQKVGSLIVGAGSMPIIHQMPAQRLPLPPLLPAPR